MDKSNLFIIIIMTAIYAMSVAGLNIKVTSQYEREQSKLLKQNLDYQIEVIERNLVIQEKNKVIDELMIENTKYKELYWNDRAEKDKGC